MKKNVIALSLLFSVNLQAQTFYNNGATVHVSAGSTLFVAGSMLAAPGSTTEILGTVRSTAGLSAATPDNAILLGLDGAFENPSNSNHINGYLGKRGNQSFTFPVGNGTALRSLQMSAPASITDHYTVAWLEGDPGIIPDPSNNNEFHPITDVGNGISSVSKEGQWDWLAVSGNGSGLTIAATLPDMATYAASAGHLRLVGWDGSRWINLSENTGASGLAEGSTLNGTMQPGIAALGIGSVNAALPVVFDDVLARVKSGNLLVQFTSISETNNEYFSILASRNGVDFKEIGRVDSAAEHGNSSTPLEYSFMININNTLVTGSLFFITLLLPAIGRRKKKVLIAAAIFSISFLACRKSKDVLDSSGVEKLFIRIVQIDKDGTKAYSKIVKVQMD